MGDTQRHERLRLLVRKLNRQRKKQAKKIDILCNDLIAAQWGFIRDLNTVSFAAHFYRSILAITDLSELLYTAGVLIRDEVGGVNVTFFLCEAGSFEVHVIEGDQPFDSRQQRLETHFTKRVVNRICGSNRLCSLDDMISMGLQVGPTLLNDISAVAIPLSQSARAPGFILMYRSSRHRFAQHDLSGVTAVVEGLSRAMQSCRQLANCPT